jgi:hypothetical protein
LAGDIDRSVSRRAALRHERMYKTMELYFDVPAVL